jgi:uncharacterized OB-fold protein
MSETKTNWPGLIPIPDADSAGYWQAAKEGYLGLPHCKSCNQYFFYPRAICPNCWSNEIELAKASGRGTIYSYTVVHRHPANPALNALTPYVVALIDLEEGPRMLSVVRGNREEVKIGAAVEAVFEELSPEISAPFFRLA